MVRLSEVMDAIDMSYDFDIYYDRETDSIEKFRRGVGQMHGDVASEEGDSEGRYIRMKFDPHLQTNLMRKFVGIVAEERVQDRLFHVIDRKGTYSSFENILIEAELLDDWLEFRDSRYSLEAKLECETCGIAYTD